MSSKDLFIRNIDADRLRENFLVSAIVSIFVIRIFLKLTHYPHIGGGAFHIAHLLWGGFFMLAAIIIFLSFLGKSASDLAAVLGGIGFGTFIDELGKFITSNNDYFFQPAVSIIYIIFVLIYLLTRLIRYQKISKREYLVNAIEMIKESAVNDFDIEEEQRAKEYLSKCDQDDPIVQSLSKLLVHLEATETAPPNLFTHFRIFLRDWYYKIASSGIIVKGFIVLLVVQTAFTFFQSASFLMTRPQLPFDQLGKLYSSILAGLFVLFGLFALRFSKSEAFRFFRIAMLITILLTDFFAFMHSQWYELIGLSANIITLMVINYSYALEKHKHRV